MIDFTELPVRPPGEALEKLTREIGKQLGLNPAWGGRGPDGGRDLFFSEIQGGAISSRPVRWLVNCKDNARSNKSVSESDVGSVLDKVRQHNAGGFLLVTTTIPGTALKDKLDALDYRNGGEICTAVWDSHELTMKLVRDEFRDLVRTYFPVSYNTMRLLSEPQLALGVIEDALPAEIALQVRVLVTPHLDRRRALRGAEVWPYDHGESEVINEIVKLLVDNEDVAGAVEVLFEQGVEFDAYMALLNRLKEYYPALGYEWLRSIVEKSDTEGVSLNAFQFISENYEFAAGDEILLASRLDSEALDIVYGDEIRNFVVNELILDPTSYELWSDLDTLSSHTRIDDVWVEELQFSGVEVPATRVEFSADISIAVELMAGGEEIGTDSFPGHVEGYFDIQGTFLEKAVVDTSSFYK